MWYNATGYLILRKIKLSCDTTRRPASSNDALRWLTARAPVLKAVLHVRHKHKHQRQHKPRVNRNDASTSARKRNAHLCLCRPGSHVGYACDYACACVVPVKQRSVGTPPLALNLFHALQQSRHGHRCGLWICCCYCCCCSCDRDTKSSKYKIAITISLKK